MDSIYDPSQFWNTISLSLTNSSTCVQLMVQVFLAQQGKAPWLTSLMHSIVLKIKMAPNYVFKWTDSYRFDLRQIYISPMNPRMNGMHTKACALKLAVDPYTKAPVQSKDLIKDNKPRSYYQGKVKITTVMMGWFNLTWQQTKQTCSDIGGYLPSMTSYKERNDLADMILGYPLSKASRMQTNDCRVVGPLCTFYIGLQSDKVSTPYLTCTSVICYECTYIYCCFGGFELFALPVILS